MIYIKFERKSFRRRSVRTLEFASNNNMPFAHISIVEKYGNGINELFNKALKEYFKRKKLIK